MNQNHHQLCLVARAHPVWCEITVTLNSLFFLRGPPCRAPGSRVSSQQMYENEGGFFFFLHREERGGAQQSSLAPPPLCHCALLWTNQRAERAASGGALRTEHTEHQQARQLSAQWLLLWCVEHRHASGHIKRTRLRL